VEIILNFVQTMFHLWDSIDKNGFNLMNGKIEPINATIWENGPLFVRIKAFIKFILQNGQQFEYELQYELWLNEKMVRIKVIGSLPMQCSLLTRFEFNENINNYFYGTPYHYDLHYPMKFGYPPFQITFEATHRYFAPLSANNKFMAAIIHEAVPTWGAMDNKVYGVLMRNSNEVNNGTNPSDNYTQIAEFAIRIPLQLTHPNTGQLLRESLNYATPLDCCLNTGHYHSKNYSLAVIKPQNAFILSMKFGTLNPKNLYVRVYHGLNIPTPISIQFDERLLSHYQNVRMVSALEKPFRNATKNRHVSIHGDRISFVATRALTTIEFC